MALTTIICLFSLQELLGEKLLKSAVENDETKLPSPNSLKGERKKLFFLHSFNTE